MSIDKIREQFLEYAESDAEHGRIEGLASRVNMTIVPVVKYVLLDIVHNTETEHSSLDSIAEALSALDTSKQWHTTGLSKHHVRQHAKAEAASGRGFNSWQHLLDNFDNYADECPVDNVKRIQIPDCFTCKYSELDDGKFYEVLLPTPDRDITSDTEVTVCYQSTIYDIARS